VIDQLLHINGHTCENCINVLLQGIGEPPLALAMSAFFAIKDAISSARKDAGISGPFKLDSPATSERIRMACVDDLTRQVRKLSPMQSSGFRNQLHG
jgi:xanthine dehydrogenase molybdopterin-binding subunit B